MNQAQKKLNISLVTQNAEEYLPFCLNSLFNQSFKDYTLSVIDNGSNDRTVAVIKENYSQIKVVEYHDNIGFAKAHNKAISWTKSEYICILNQDVILEKEYLKNLIDFMDDNREVGSVAGKILSWDFNNNLKLNSIDSKGLKIFKNHRVIEIDQGQDDKVENTNLEVFGVSGAVPIYRLEVLKKIKLENNLKADEYFDELFFSYKEDVDLAYRLRLAGFKSFYIPTSIAYHDRTVKGENDLSDKTTIKSRKNKDQMVKIYSYKNHLQVLYKNEFFSNLIKYFFHIFWYELKKLIYILFNEPSTLRGLKLYFKQLKQIKKKRNYIKKNIRKINAKELAKWYN